LKKRTYVAFDLETTGLSPEKDAIIEFGGVRFRSDGTIVDKFSTLVNPQQELSFDIQQLTGIEPDDLRRAPTWQKVKRQIETFIGDDDVVGHNIAFDLSFLQANSIYPPGEALDTFHLATILLPTAPQYSLGALCQQLDVPLNNAHRALFDALATAQLFLALIRVGTQLPLPVLAAINDLAKGQSWRYRSLFLEMEDEHTAAGALPEDEYVDFWPYVEQHAPAIQRGRALRRALREDIAAHAGEADFPDEETYPEDRLQYTPVDSAGIAAYLSAESPLRDLLPDYEVREPQIEMARQVAEAFNEGEHLLVEAGTGTGKSLAYLLPAVSFAVTNHARVVVSTATINLQDQLFHKDLPTLQHLLSYPFRVALMKGRSNYICPRRFEAMRHRENLSEEELNFLARLMVWLPNTEAGDVNEQSLNRYGDQFNLWRQVCSDPTACTNRHCAAEGDHCFFRWAKQAAAASDLLVVNHALLLADMNTDNRVLPSYKHLIVDEAHQLETVLSNQIGFSLTQGRLASRLRSLYRTESGHAPLLKRLSKSAPAVAVGAKLAGALAAASTAVQNRLPRTEDALRAAWQTLAEFFAEQRTRKASDKYAVRLRLTEAIRKQPLWSDVEIEWEAAVKALELVGKDVAAIRAALTENEDKLPPGALEVNYDLGAFLTDLRSAVENIRGTILKPDATMVYWLERQPGRNYLVLRSAPLHVGSLMEKFVWQKMRTVVLTSATLRVAGSFDYLRDRLHVFEARELTAGSPFDYRKSTLIYTPTDIPAPNAPRYQETVERALLELSRATDGRLLALFTSYNQLRRTVRAIGPTLMAEGFTILQQGIGSRTHLLDSFRNTKRAVLFGTRSFWEGVDVVGEALSCLVIVRLPFDVPNDPLVAARGEQYDDAFLDFQVPNAILRFRQGFGRLIRSKSDRGVVVILDNRVRSRRYGHLFLESLPDCETRQAPLAQLPPVAARWIKAKPENEGL